jgi:hypothetical protein
VGTHWLKSAHVRRLRGSTAVTGADGSPCGVIAQMMVGIVAVLKEDSKRERMSMTLYYLHIYTLTSNHLIRVYFGVRAARRTPLFNRGRFPSRPEDCIRAKNK